jgi:hypothetical protein
MALPIDPIIVWGDLNNRIDLSFYLKPVELTVLTEAFLAALMPIAPALAIVNPDGARGTSCILELTGDWSAPVEVDIQWVTDVAAGGGAVYTPPSAVTAETAALEIAAHISGSAQVLATAKGTRIFINAEKEESTIHILSATPVYVPAP